jgi:hypothetical protein
VEEIGSLNNYIVRLQSTYTGACLLLNADAGIILISCCLGITDMRLLTTGIRSEKCVVWRFRRCANVIQCTYTNLDSITYYTLRLCGITYCSLATNLQYTSTFTDLHTKLNVYPLLQILVTHFSANLIPRTHTTPSAARERTNNLVFGSCKHKLEHVQTCSSTRYCLTQHPSDTLRLFQELNCCTSYSMLL